MTSMTLNSGLCTLSRVIRGGGGGSFSPSEHGTVNLNNNNQVSDADFQKGFESWCQSRGRTFSSEEDKRQEFQWFCDNYPYGRCFSLGGLPMSRSGVIDLLRGTRIHGRDPKKAKEIWLKMWREADCDEHDEENDLTMDEFIELVDKRCFGTAHMSPHETTIDGKTFDIQDFCTTFIPDLEENHKSRFG
ncbi:hypothetical protein TSUD_314440 [Trifolium subterraneum]|uniref:Uncharacterized protein n=1 Tax=Trifolium subterraneum TaxID=3900 RepID=A0A2Z6NBI8_TRISU|nr:hypothetical protein TSUD_314440 [Trifolium subterraneum]